MPNKKKLKLLFIPHYIGSLRYFEKLIPYLNNKYDIFFLFLQTEKHRLPEMIEYCHRKKYKYYLIEKYSTKKLCRKIPFYYITAMSYNYKRGIKKLLQDTQIKKIVSAIDTKLYYFYLFKKAGGLGINTMVLQWASTGEIIIKRKLEKRLHEKKFSIKKTYNYLTKILQKFIFGLYLDNPKILGGSNAKKFGVINQQAYDLFKNAGINEKKMSVVGYLDFYFSQKVYDELNNNAQKRKHIAKKYNINLNKKNIVIYSTPFNTKDLKILSDKKQLNYYKNIVKILKKAFNKSEADILFKLHPAENINLYKPLKKLGVKIYDKNIINEELICFADLYIAHHSTTNFIPIIMKKDAIFINFINLKFMDSTKKYFGIKRYLSGENEFKKLLTDFKNNKLEKQYELNEEIFVKDSLNKIVKWID